MLAVSTSAFAEYQRTQAWTWEHMALARARPVFGSIDGREHLKAIVSRILGEEREGHAVASDAAKMRAEMARHKRPSGRLDVKLGPGGLVDLEFAIHVLQLTRHRGLDPNLGTAVEQLVKDGLVDPSIIEAHRLLTRMLIALRLVAPDLDPTAETRELLAKACRASSWDELLERHDSARRSIAALWNEAKGA